MDLRLYRKNVANWLIATFLPIKSQINFIFLKSLALFSDKISKDTLVHNVVIQLYLYEVLIDIFSEMS